MKDSLLGEMAETSRYLQVNSIKGNMDSIYIYIPFTFTSRYLQVNSMKGIVDSIDGGYIYTIFY